MEERPPVQESNQGFCQGNHLLSSAKGLLFSENFKYARAFITAMKRFTKIRHRRSAEEITADIEEAMKDPDFRKFIREFIRQTTS